MELPSPCNFPRFTQNLLFAHVMGCAWCMGHWGARCLLWIPIPNLAKNVLFPDGAFCVLGPDTYPRSIHKPTFPGWQGVSVLLPYFCLLTWSGFKKKFLYLPIYRWVLLKSNFWEHENLSSLSVIWLIYIKLYKEKEKKILTKNPG